QWCIEFGLLTKEQADKLWRDQNRHAEEPAREANRVYDHRLRAVTTGVGSRECVAVCLRHIVKHRGFDYHQTEEGTHPWGDEWKYADILDWLRKTPISQEYADDLRREMRDMPDLFPEEKLHALSLAMDSAVARYQDNPVEKMLREHCAEKGHPNLRVFGRRHNFPRELLKHHAHAILTHSRQREMIAADRFEAAVLRLLGRCDANGNWPLTERIGRGKEMTDPGCIMDYHRRTRKEAEKLWENKTGKCPYAPLLSKSGHPIAHDAKRSPKRDLRIRRFMLLQFLAERTFVASNYQRHYAHSDTVRWALDFLGTDEAALVAKTARPKVGIAELKTRWREAFQVRLAKDSESHNKDYFVQLHDLLCAKAGDLGARASLAAESAAILYAVATLHSTDFEAKGVRDRLAGLGYYQWRVNNVSNWGLYPQVEFLLGARQQYDEEGNSRDRRDSANCRRRGADRTRWGCSLADDRPQEHGILRRLFAGQLKDAHSRPVAVRQQMNRADGLPDYVVIEVVGDMPRNKDDKRDLQNAAKAKRKAKDGIFEHLHIPVGASDGLKKKALLFDQQTNADGKLVCPYTGKVLEGLTPHSTELEVEHIYPQQRGGLTVMSNLCLTLRAINAAKGNQTPCEIAGRTIDGVTFLPWAEMKAALTGFRWGSGKRSIFEWDKPEVPDFQNMTRMAQLARQLKAEITHWLGIRRRAAAEIEDPTQCEAAIQKETWERIGTPVGGMTHACAEVWCPKESFPDYWREVKFGTRTDWVKERLCQRHHLWDALILSHIPPGIGMNNTFCGGIFRVTQHEESGTPVLKPLPHLGPDLDAMNNRHLDECLVISPRQRHSKQSRTQETIQSPADGNGRHWSREPLSKYTAKPNMTETEILQLLRDAGLPPKSFTTGTDEAAGLKYLSAWWNERNPERFSLAELEKFLSQNSMLTPEVKALLPEWWKTDDGKSPAEKKVSAASIGDLLKKAG
ncbi:HNH endonuclease domain-containing protein, partial [Prosthecobacter sp.]|uniref:HNH endonuclease domain-containing protein n=1 Tax=Prosthecobacter sp. TaxID=1965333 RepID=UPI00248A3703